MEGIKNITNEVTEPFKSNRCKNFRVKLQGLYPLRVQSANAAAVKSAVVPGLQELPFERSFLSNSARLFLPLAVSKPPSSSIALASRRLRGLFLCLLFGR